MCPQKDKILTYLPFVWMATELGDDVTQEAQPFPLGKRAESTTHRTVFHGSDEAKDNLFLTSLCSI